MPSRRPEPAGSAGLHEAWPADRVERRAVRALVPYARNARTHSEDQVRQIAAAIREWGWTVPILIDESDQLIAGHGRVLAAQLIGLDEVPVMIARGWSDEKKRAYIIADNKIALNAGWDNQLLALEIADLKSLAFDVSLIGFADFELASLLSPGRAGLTDPDDAPDAPEHPISRLGETWTLGRHRLRCGDATSARDVHALMAGAKPNVMVTDPPYGVDYDPDWRLHRGINKPTQILASGKVGNDDRTDWSPAWALFPGAVAYVWYPSLHAASFEISLRAEDFEIRSQIIWRKSSIVIGRGNYHWQHEPCFYAVRKGKTAKWNGDRKQSTIWDIPTTHRTQGDADDGRTIHSTQKPVECMRRPIVNNSRAGEPIYDPFLGSGTTVIACEMEGRSCLAMELDPAYCDVAIKRWEAFTGDAAVLEDDAVTFAEATKARAQNQAAAE